MFSARQNKVRKIEEINQIKINVLKINNWPHYIKIEILTRDIKNKNCCYVTVPVEGTCYYLDQ